MVIGVDLQGSQLVPLCSCLIYSALFLRKVLDINALESKFRITLEIFAVKSLSDDRHILEGRTQTNISDIDGFIRCGSVHSIAFQETTPRYVHFDHALHAILKQLIFTCCGMFDRFDLTEGTFGLLSAHDVSIP